MNNGTLKPSAKNLGSTAEWASSTVRTGEAVQSRYTTGLFGGSLNESLIARAKAWVMICAMGNATACSNQTMRLYRKVGRKRGGKAITDRKRLKHLRSPFVGVKAMQYAEQAGEFEEVIDHPVARLLRNPSPWYRGTDFFRLLFLWRELCGNSFIGVVGPLRGEPTGLLPLMPQYMRIQPDITDFVEGYWYGRATERITWLEADEVIHHKHAPSPFDPYNGIGPLYAVLAEADLDAATTTDETARWLNGARPDFIAKLPKGTPEEQRNAFKASINAQHRGPTNAGKFLVVTEAEIEPLSWSMKEMEYAASRENIRERIFAAFDYPESYFKMNDANLASSTTGSVQRMRDGIQPRLIQDAENWTETLLPHYGIEPGDMWFAYDNCVPDDDVANATRVAQLVPIGVITVNEGRDELGYEPSDDPKADVLHDSTQATAQLSGNADLSGSGDNTVGDTAGNISPPVAPDERTALQQFVASITDGSFPLEAADPFIAATYPWVSPELRAAIVTGATTAKEQADAKAEEDAKRQAEMMAAKNPPMPVKAIETETKSVETGDVPPKAAVDELMRRAALFFAFVNPQITEHIGRGMTPADALRAVGFDHSLIQHLAPELEKEFGAGFLFGKAEADAFIATLEESVRGSIVPSFDLASPEAQRFLSQYTIRLARSVSATTEEAMRTAIDESLQAGETLAQTTARIGQVLDDRTPMESERIARTEASRAYNRGREASWQASGVVNGKEWILSGNPCPICVAMSERFNSANAVAIDHPFIPLGGTFEYEPGKVFTANYEAIYGPPVHPNCACGLGARFSV